MNPKTSEASKIIQTSTENFLNASEFEKTSA